MQTVEAALEAILGQVQPLSVERVDLLSSRGRVLAEEIRADISVPPFTNSAVDGYAVRAQDIVAAQPESPVRLRTLGEISAGIVSREILVPGTACRIMTGAPVPVGADTIVMIEDTRNTLPATVDILEAAPLGTHLRWRGEDVSEGSLVFKPGMRIRAAEIGMLATMGRTEVSVVRSPRVAIISTGDEVVDVTPGELPPPGKIRNSNRYALSALVQEYGGILGPTLHLPDSPEATEIAFGTLTSGDDPVDVIITAGGVSVGDRDYVKPALEKLGTLTLWKVAMKPGKPLAFGHIGRTLFFGLPGNPVSAQVTFLLFVRPALWKLAGRERDDLGLPEVEATLLADVAHIPGRREYIRAITTTRNGHFVTGPTGAQGSHLLHSLTLSNSLLILPESSSGGRAGEIVRVLLLPS